MKSSFYVVLPSNACPSTQPDNEANSYMIDWESALEFQGEWEVALTEFSFNYAPVSMKSPSEIKFSSLDIVKYNLSIKDSSVKINNDVSFYRDDRVLISYNKNQNFRVVSGLPEFTIVFDTLKNANIYGFTKLRNYTDTNSITGDMDVNLFSENDIQIEIEFINNPILTSFNTPDNYNYSHNFVDIQYIFSIFNLALVINNKPGDYKDTRISIKLLEGNHIRMKSKRKGFILWFNNIEEAHKFGFNNLQNFSTDYILTSDFPIQNGTDDIKTVKILFPLKPMIERLMWPYEVFTNSEQMVTFFKKIPLFETFSIADGIVSFKLSKDTTSISFEPQYARKLGFLKQNTFQRDITWTAEKKTYLMNSFNQYYIYSSIADPILVGGVHVPLMKAVWVESKHDLGDVINENIEQPMYLSISSQSINNIEVQIRDDSGELINFPYGSKSNLTLHFRKK